MTRVTKTRGIRSVPIAWSRLGRPSTTYISAMTSWSSGPIRPRATSSCAFIAESISMNSAPIAIPVEATLIKTPTPRWIHSQSPSTQPAPDSP